MNVCNDKDFHFVYGDVRDYERLDKYVQKADVIIPLAAIVGFPACEKDKQLATDVNFIHIKNIVDNSSKQQLILYPNSNSGYGIGEKDNYCTEESQLKPISLYGKTKVLTCF